MALGSSARRRSPVVAIDLGSHSTKAVYLQQKGASYELLQFAVVEAPVYEKGFSPAVLAEHLKGVVQQLGAKARRAVLMLGVNDSVLRQAELPMAAVADLRLMLKFNSKAYLQQDLPDHVFDCYVLPPRGGGTAGSEPSKPAKCRALVAGAKQQLVGQLQQALKEAGLIPDQMAPSQIGTANAFEMAEPETFSKEVVALVDLGFKNSTISVLMNGELSLSRVVALGGDRVTLTLAEMLGKTHADAEQMKLSITEETQAYLSAALAPLGRELRASIDFFEKQEDKTVMHVFFSGGAARSNAVVEALQSELMVPCKTWNPVAFLRLALPPERMGQLEESAPLLAAAAGGALSAF